MRERAPLRPVRISSPIGEYDYHVDRVAYRDRRVEVLGRLGEWQTTTIIEPSDLLALLRNRGVMLVLAGAALAVTRRLTRV